MLHILPTEPLLLEVALILYCSGCTQNYPFFQAVGTLFIALAILPTPHESPWYPKPLTNLPSLPCSFFSFSSFSVAVGTGSPLPARCYQTVSAFIRSRQRTHFHRHAHTHTNAFWGLPQSEALKHIFLMLSPNKKDNLFAQPTSKSPSQPVSKSPYAKVFRYIWYSGRMPCGYASRSAGYRRDLSSRCLAVRQVVTDEDEALFCQVLPMEMLLAVLLKHVQTQYKHQFVPTPTFVYFTDHYNKSGCLDWLDLVAKEQGPTSILLLVRSRFF